MSGLAVYTFWVSAVLSIISFALFITLAIEQILALWPIRGHAGDPKKLLVRAPSGLETAATGGVWETPEKVLEGLAKLTEAPSKAPLPVVTLIGSLLFLLVSLGDAAIACKKCGPTDGGEKKATLLTEPERCLVGSFREGDHHLPGGLHDSPPGCLHTLSERLRTERPEFLLIVGHCDLRELKPKSARIYRSNLSLAYRRAVAMKDYLLVQQRARPTGIPVEDIDTRAVLLLAGPSHVGNEVSSSELTEDRIAEVVPFWVELRSKAGKSE